MTTQSESFEKAFQWVPEYSAMTTRDEIKRLVDVFEHERMRGDPDYMAQARAALMSAIDRVLKDAERYRWQPIATAPKDGTPLWGFMPSYYQGKGGQSLILWLHGAWMDNRAWKTNPSHWMPLPPPPQDQEQGK